VERIEGRREPMLPSLVPATKKEKVAERILKAWWGMGRFGGEGEGGP
jgi:hypothetical protein